MRHRIGVRLETALICAGVFVLLAVVGNPFVPDICTSMGYGYPLPVYISWCECFFEAYPPSINVSYIAFDSAFWIGLWWVVSLTRISHKQARASAAARS